MEQLTNPDQIFGTMMGHVASAVVKAGIDLGVFDHLAAGTNDLQGLKQATGIPERSLRILLDALVGLGLCAKADGRYSLNPATELFLVKQNPIYLGSMSAVLGHPLIWERMGRLTEIVRAGGAAGEENPANRESHAFWTTFAEASRGLSAPQAAIIADIVRPERFSSARILDIACGSGTYGFVMLERAGEGARLTSVDWPNVLDAAREGARERGIEARIDWRPGSIFDVDYGPPHDVVIASQIYHHFDVEQNLALSRRLYAALKPGGELVINDAIPDDQRRDRPFPLVFAVLMLATTDHGDTFTFEQYRTILTRADFVDIELHQPAIPSQIITARRR